MANQIRDISYLTETTQIALRLFLDACKEEGLDICITETYRTQARQDRLYAQGRTTEGDIVTWTKYSVHTERRAWDICKNIKGQEYTDKQFFYKCGEIAKNLGITWGGDWKQKDLCHFQIDEDWKSPIATNTTPIEKKNIILNGVDKEVNVININGNNFIKMQDLNAPDIKVEYKDKKIHITTHQV